MGLIQSATMIAAVGNPPRQIAEYVGHLNSGDTENGATHIAICVPAFSPEAVHRGSV